MKKTTLIRGGFALLSALSLSQAGCTKKRTSVVLVLNTDIPRSAWGLVRVTARGTGGGAQVDYYQMQEFRPGSSNLPFPGTLLLSQQGAETDLEVSVDVELTSGNGTPFQVRAKARYFRDAWRQLPIFLPYQCSDEAIRRQCAERTMLTGMEYTCGAAGADPCVLVQRNELEVFEPNAGLPEPPDAAAPMMDAAVEAGMDASMPDSMPDVVIGPDHPALFSVWPRSGAHFSGMTPTLSVRLPASCPEATGIEYVLCPGLSATGDTCSGVVRFTTTVPACSGQIVNARVPSMGAPSVNGPWSWAARLVTNTATLRRSGPLSFRPMNLRANNNAMGVTSILGVVPDFDGDGRGDLLVHSVPFFTSMRVPPMFGRAVDVISPGMMPLTELSLASITGVGTTGSFGRAMVVLGDAQLNGGHDVAVLDSLDAMNGSSGFRFNYAGGTLTAHPTQRVFSLATPPQPEVGDVAVSADFNRDGFEDILVGSRGAMPIAPRVFYGSATGYSASTSLTTMNPQRYFGYEMAAGCDINGDGFPDAVLSNKSSLGGGSVLVYLGGATGLATTPAHEITDAETSSMIGSGLGESLACNGDFNSDGFADIAIGAFDVGNNRRGGAIVLGGGASGSPATRVLFASLGPMSTSDAYGTVIEFVGDMVMGLPTVAIGSPLQGFGLGQVDLVGFQSAGMFQRQTISSALATETGQFGAALRFLGPIGPNAEPGFAVGMPFAGTDASGRIEVFRKNGSNAIRMREISVVAPGALMGTTYGGSFGR
jgi:hypothetical protein